MTFGLGCECFSLTKVIYATIQLELAIVYNVECNSQLLTGTIFNKLFMRKMQG